MTPLAAGTASSKTSGRLALGLPILSFTLAVYLADLVVAHFVLHIN